jgi:hypothetical protein
MSRSTLSFETTALKGDRAVSSPSDFTFEADEYPKLVPVRYTGLRRMFTLAVLTARVLHTDFAVS